MRESIPQKAARLLSEGGIFVRYADGKVVRAICHGDHGIYVLTFDGSRWECDCPARKACSHLRALELVTTPVREAA